ncbi:MAG: hypothetical protein CMA88_03825 [Euryarchaeota archaeon]|nr:hypothetical protein [Euryarchaeota archaeon]
MNRNGKRTISVLLVAIMLLAGCSGQVDDPEQQISGCTDEAATNYDSDATNSDNSSCTYEDEVEEETGEGGEETGQAPSISVPHTDGCDNTNPIHCMLPFPSDAFLREDEGTETGLRIHYSANSIPGSGLSPVVEIPILNTRDGASPSTQIMTAFVSEPDVTDLAGQYTIGKSLDPSHPTLLFNLENMELVPHWVELDARSEPDQSTILHIRTIQALDHNTPFAVVIRDLVDSQGETIPAHEGFAVLRDGLISDSPDIESRRERYEDIFSQLTNEGPSNNSNPISRETLQAVWWFHTASTDSIVGDVIEMRNDALDRIGTNGLGCTIESNSEMFNDGNRTHWLITGTYTSPQYTESFFAPTLISRDSNGAPEFVENREIPFWLMIPNSANESGNPAPLTVWGHGFLGEGNTSGLWGWGNENNVAMIGTSFYGWASDDVISIEYAVLNIGFFQHQAERLQQSMVNQAVMVRTFMGVCSDLPEFYQNGTKLVDASSPTYTGYSNGGLRGPSIIGLSPDLNRGVLWAGGSAFSHIIERCTQYDRFYEPFSSSLGYSNQMDRAIVMSVAQYLWDPTETETFLYMMQDGYNGEVEPFELMALFSIGDFQISNISSSRMMRTGGIPLLDSSTITPYGMQTVSDGHNGSVGVFFDGGYELAPEGNVYGQEPHSAHNAIGGLKIARLMAFNFLMNGTVIDTCEGDCTFSSQGLSWS